MKTLMKTIAASTIAATMIGFAGIALAETTPPAPTDQTAHHWDHKAMHEHMVDKLFARFDPAKTGSISLDAFLKPVDARFDKIETKKQGFIDRDELVAFFGTANPEKVDAMLKRLDLKHDGKITKDEFEQHARKRFALVDLYNDGKITKDEAMLAGPDLMLLVPHHKHGGPGEWQHRHEMNHAKPNAQ